MKQADYETKKFLKFWLNTRARYMYLNGEQHSKPALEKYETYQLAFQEASKLLWALEASRVIAMSNSNLYSVHLLKQLQVLLFISSA